MIVSYIFKLTMYVHEKLTKSKSHKKYFLKIENIL